MQARKGSRILVAVVFAMTSGWVHAKAPEGLLGEVARYSERPTLGPALAVVDWKVSTGQMDLQGTRGIVTSLLAGDEVIGYHFQGAGRFSYRGDAAERATFASNHAHNLNGTNSHAKLEATLDGPALTEDVTGFTVWFAGPPLPAPTGTPATRSPEAFEASWAFFNREGLSDRGQAFALSRMNTPGQPLVRAEITGTDAAFLYTYDPAFDMVERLSEVGDPYMPAAYDGVRMVSLSERPLGWSWQAPMSAALTLTHVDINLRSQKSQADLLVKETLLAGIDNLRVVPLDLFNMVDRYHKRGVYQVRHVRDGHGKELRFHHQNDRILLELASPARAGEPFELIFEYGGQILLHPNGDNYWELGVAPWFPQPDLGGQYYTVHATFRTPPEDVPMACGTTLRREQSDQGNLLEVRIDKPVQFFAAFAGAYTLKEEVKDGLTIRVATYANLGGRQAQILSLARQTIQFYEELFEAFPFREFNIVQVNSWGFGQAPPGMMIITNEAFNSQTDWVSRLFVKGINQRFAHEIAHQYFGHLLKMPSSEEQWITESFANHASALAIRSMKNQGTSAYEGLLSRWRNDAEAYTAESAIPFVNRLRWLKDPRGSFLARTFLLYEKGGLLLAALHKEMGDKTFALFMKSLMANYRWKFVTTQGVEQLASMAARKDLKPLFRDCYWGTAMPPK